MDNELLEDYSISNVKISVTFLSTIPVETFKKNIQEKRSNLVCFKKNIIIIKCEYTATIFFKPPGKYHVNITKIKGLHNIERSIFYIKKNFFPSSDFIFVKYEVDNITATLKLRQNFCLKKLSRTNSNVKFNSERFPGAFVTFDDLKGTAVVFTSGRINILGCVTKLQINAICRNLMFLLKEYAVC